MTPKDATPAMTARTISRTARQVTRPWALVSETWAYRWLVWHYGWAFIRRRYKGTWIGWPWIPLRPALEIGSAVLLFGGFLQVPTGDRPYLIYYGVGFAAWVLFERTARFSMRSLQMNRRVYDRVYAPRLAAIVSAIAIGILDGGLYFSIGLIAAVYYRWSHGTTYLFVDAHAWMIAVGLALLMAYGVLLGMLVAPIVVHARDFLFFFRYLIGAFYLFTPIIYPLSLLPDKYKSIATYNPLSAPVEMVKYGLLQTEEPHWQSLASSVGTLGVLFIVLLFVFGRSARHAAEET